STRGAASMSGAARGRNGVSVMCFPSRGAAPVAPCPGSAPFALLNHQDAPISTGLAGHQEARDIPIFRGLGQFGLYILALREKAFCTSFHQRLGETKQLGQRRQGARGDHVDRISKSQRKVLDSRGMYKSRKP